MASRRARRGAAARRGRVATRSGASDRQRGRHGRRSGLAVRAREPHRTLGSGSAGGGVSGGGAVDPTIVARRARPEPRRCVGGCPRRPKSRPRSRRSRFAGPAPSPACSAEFPSARARAWSRVGSCSFPAPRSMSACARSPRRSRPPARRRARRARLARNGRRAGRALPSPHPHRAQRPRARGREVGGQRVLRSQHRRATRDQRRNRCGHHLHNIYRKLHIGSRMQVCDLIGASVAIPTSAPAPQARERS